MNTLCPQSVGELLRVAGAEDRDQGEDSSSSSGEEEEAVCQICLKMCDEDRLLLCDGQGGRCNAACHSYCVGLDEIPDGDWFCPACESARSESTRRRGTATIPACGGAKEPILASGGAKEPPQVVTEVPSTSKPSLAVKEVAHSTEPTKQSVPVDEAAHNAAPTVEAQTGKSVENVAPSSRVSLRWGRQAQLQTPASDPACDVPSSAPVSVKREMVDDQVGSVNAVSTVARRLTVKTEPVEHAKAWAGRLDRQTRNRTDVNTCTKSAERAPQ